MSLPEWRGGGHKNNDCSINKLILNKPVYQYEINKSTVRGCQRLAVAALENSNSKKGHIKTRNVSI